MKRRKKLWIACAALTVVVALCAFALLYRRGPPYRFLEGASLKEILNYSATVRLSSSTGPLRTMSERTTYSYVVDGTFQSVTGEARKELTDQDNWKWSITKGFMAVAHKPMMIEAVAVHPAVHTPGSGPPRVLVTVTKETTPFDRVLAWLHNR